MYVPPVAFEHAREFLYFGLVLHLGARSNSSRLMATRLVEHWLVLS